MKYDKTITKRERIRREQERADRLGRKVSWRELRRKNRRKQERS